MPNEETEQLNIEKEIVEIEKEIAEIEKKLLEDEKILQDTEKLNADTEAVNNEQVEALTENVDTLSASVETLMEVTTNQEPVDHTQNTYTVQLSDEQVKMLKGKYDNSIDVFSFACVVVCGILLGYVAVKGALVHWKV